MDDDGWIVLLAVVVLVILLSERNATVSDSSRCYYAHFWGFLWYHLHCDVALHLCQSFLQRILFRLYPLPIPLLPLLPQPLLKLLTPLHCFCIPICVWPPPIRQPQVMRQRELLLIMPVAQFIITGQQLGQPWRIALHSPLDQQIFANHAPEDSAMLGDVLGQVSGDFVGVVDGRHAEGRFDL